jgi:hypothetical protein
MPPGCFFARGVALSARWIPDDSKTRVSKAGAETGAPPGGRGGGNGKSRGNKNRTQYPGGRLRNGVAAVSALSCYRLRLSARASAHDGGRWGKTVIGDASHLPQRAQRLRPPGSQLIARGAQAGDLELEPRSYGGAHIITAAPTITVRVFAPRASPTARQEACRQRRRAAHEVSGLAAHCTQNHGSRQTRVGPRSAARHRFADASAHGGARLLSGRQRQRKSEPRTK